MNKLSLGTILLRSRSRFSVRVIVIHLLILVSQFAALSAQAAGAIFSPGSGTLSQVQNGTSDRAQKSPDAWPSKGGGTEPQHSDLPNQPGGPQVNPQQADPQTSRPNGHHGPRPGYRLPNYSWGRGGVSRLRSYFREDLLRVNRWHRRPLFVGGYFPHRYRMYIQPIPHGLMRYLPPVPRGYAIGYFGGYSLVYDPRTLLIVSVVDLYRY